MSRIQEGDIVNKLFVSPVLIFFVMAIVTVSSYAETSRRDFKVVLQYSTKANFQEELTLERRDKKILLKRNYTSLRDNSVIEKDDWPSRFE